MVRKAVSIEVVDENGVRYLVVHDSAGKTVRKEIVSKTRPKRRPRRPRQVIRKNKDFTPKKRY